MKYSTEGEGFRKGEEAVSTMWVFAVVLLQRAGELALCRRNRRALVLRGGKEVREKQLLAGSIPSRG